MSYQADVVKVRQAEWRRILAPLRAAHVYAHGKAARIRVSRKHKLGRDDLPAAAGPREALWELPPAPRAVLLPLHACGRLARVLAGERRLDRSGEHVRVAGDRGDDGLRRELVLLRVIITVHQGVLRRRLRDVAHAGVRRGHPPAGEIPERGVLDEVVR